MCDYENILKLLFEELNSLIVIKDKQKDKLNEMNNKRNIYFNEECKRLSSTLWQYKCLFDSKKSLKSSIINTIISVLITILSVLINISIHSFSTVLSLLSLLSTLFTIIQIRNIIVSSKEIKKENELLKDNDKDYYSLEKELEEALELLRMLDDDISKKNNELSTTENKISECKERIILIEEQILSIKVNIANQALGVKDEEMFDCDSLVLNFRNKNNL